MNIKKYFYILISALLLLLFFSFSATCSMCGIKIVDNSDIKENKDKDTVTNGEETNIKSENTQTEQEDETTDKQEIIQNADPYIVSVNVPTPNANTNCQIIAVAVDPDGDKLTYEWNSGDGIIVDISGDTLTWMAPTSAGDYTIELKVTDGNGGEDRELIKITVLAATPKIIYGAVENECGYIYTDRFNFNAVVDNGNPVYMGDTDNGSWVKGFISFEIAVFPGAKVRSAELKLNINTIRNDPSFFPKALLCQSASNWGANPLKPEYYSFDSYPLQEYSSSGDGNIVCGNENLVKKIQEDMDNGYNRSQFVLLFYSVELDKPGINNGVPDGWLYYTNDMSLYVEYDQ